MPAGRRSYSKPLNTVPPYSLLPAGSNNKTGAAPVDKNWLETTPATQSLHNLSGQRLAETSKAQFHGEISLYDLQTLPPAIAGTLRPHMHSMSTSPGPHSPQFLQKSLLCHLNFLSFPFYCFCTLCAFSAQKVLLSSISNNLPLDLLFLTPHVLEGDCFNQPSGFGHLSSYQSLLLYCPRLRTSFAQGSF